jgi:hypothetical protein
MGDGLKFIEGVLHLLQLAALVCFGADPDDLAEPVDYLLELVLHVAVQKDVHFHNEVFL